MELMQIKNLVVFYATLSHEAEISRQIPDIEHLGAHDPEHLNETTNAQTCSEG